MIKRLEMLLLSAIRRQTPKSELNGNLEKAVDIVLLVRELLKDWDDLSESARRQMLIIIEDRAGNLAASINGWHQLAEERQRVIDSTKNEMRNDETTA